MVKHYADELTPVVVAITCNCCRKRFSHVTETQEFLSWRDTGGYGNKTFGDGRHVELDLCQYCVKNVLGQYVIVTNP